MQRDDAGEDQAQLPVAERIFVITARHVGPGVSGGQREALCHLVGGMADSSRAPATAWWVHFARNRRGPVGALAQVAVISQNLNQIVVQSSRDVTSHYLVNGVRRAFVDWQVVAAGQEHEVFHLALSCDRH